MPAINRALAPRSATGISAVELTVAIAKLVWRNLPMLVAMDGLFALAGLATVAAVFSGGWLAAPPIAAFTLAPVWAGIVATTDALARHEEVRLRDLFRNICRHALTGGQISLAPALLLSAVVAALLLPPGSAQSLWLPALLLVCGSGVTMVALALPALFSLATATTLRGLPLWRASLGIVAWAPAMFLGTIAFALLAWLAVGMAGGPGVLLFVPGPLALSFSAMTADALRSFAAHRLQPTDTQSNQ